MKKTLALVLVVVALGATLAHIWLSPEQSLKRAVEQEGSTIAGSAVRVEKVSYSKQAGVFILTGVAIANPHGFPEGDVVVAPVVEVAVDPGGLDQPLVRIERLVVSAPRVRVLSGPDGSNFEVLEKTLKKRPVAADARRFVVGTLAIQDAKAVVKGDSETPLLSMRSHDLGAGSGGMSGVELARHMAQDVGQRVRLASGIESIKSGIRSLLGD
jgi:hypothetical protein